MSRILRWGLGLLLAAGLVLGAFLLLPFQSWLPGGTVGGISTGKVVNGTAFNRLFPSPQPGETLVFTQEKRGFSEARLKRASSTKALLAISDTITAPEARSKFSASQEQLKGWPLVEQGPQASALLVEDRFQVKVIAQGVGLDAEQRHELLGDFDLQGLAALNPEHRAGRRAAKALPASRSQPVSLAPQPAPARADDAVSPVMEPAA